MNNTYYTIIKTGFGWVGIAGSSTGLCRITLPQISLEETMKLIPPQAIVDSSFFGSLPERMKRYFDGIPVTFPDILDFSNITQFQKSVFEATRLIVYGETRSYSWIATHAGKPFASRAVGQALSHNPFPVIIPCHRVIMNDGTPGGFYGGQVLKKRLLDMEYAVYKV